MQHGYASSPADMKEVERHSSLAVAQEVAEEVREFTLAQFSLFGSLKRVPCCHNWSLQAQASSPGYIFRLLDLT